MLVSVPFIVGDVEGFSFYASASTEALPIGYHTEGIVFNPKQAIENSLIVDIISPTWSRDRARKV